MRVILLRTSFFALLNPPSFSSLHHSRRRFSVLQRGNDREVTSLFARLGFATDSEADRVRRTPEELRQGFLREGIKLKDPQNDPKDASQLDTLQRAYALLRDGVFRANYAAHHYASPDACLHVCVDGGQIAANFNPEHRDMDFVDHTNPLHTSADAARSFGDSPSALLCGSESASTVRPHSAREGRSPQRGAHISFLLRLSFDEAALGCTRTAVFERRPPCLRCDGHGRQQPVGQKESAASGFALGDGKRPPPRARVCPQCRGRGSVHLPSATYHVERRCSFCVGTGTAPMPPCHLCKGAGVGAAVQTHLPLDIRPGASHMSERRVCGMGHAGVRGGAAGDLLVTLFVQEHRRFHRDGVDLHVVLPVPLATSLLGGFVHVPTLRGRRQLHVPPCARNGQRLVLHGEGIPLDDAGGNAAKSGNGKGDLCVHLLIVLPSAEGLTGRQRHALDVFTEASLSHEGGEGNDGGDPLDDKDAERKRNGFTSMMGETDVERTHAAMKQRYRHWLPGA